MTLFIRNYLFIIILLLLDTNILAHGSKHKSKNSKSAKKAQKKQDVQNNLLPQRQPMKINNDLQVRGNITSSKVLAFAINVTGQSIIANSTKAVTIKANKVGVDTILTDFISSSNVN